MTVKHAVGVVTDKLYPVPGVMNNVYYVTGCLDNQVKNEARRRVKDSGVKIYLTYITEQQFLVKKNDQSVEIAVLINDNSMPISMVLDRESFGGLKYATKVYW